MWENSGHAAVATATSSSGLRVIYLAEFEGVKRSCLPLNSLTSSVHTGNRSPFSEVSGVPLWHHRMSVKRVVTCKDAQILHWPHIPGYVAPEWGHLTLVTSLPHCFRQQEHHSHTQTSTPLQTSFSWRSYMYEACNTPCFHLPPRAPSNSLADFLVASRERKQRVVGGRTPPTILLLQWLHLCNLDSWLCFKISG